jgi:hypothetical protein
MFTVVSWPAIRGSVPMLPASRADTTTAAAPTSFASEQAALTS